jgi:NtrC-family two-component system response regulator AlgB
LQGIKAETGAFHDDSLSKETTVQESQKYRIDGGHGANAALKNPFFTTLVADDHLSFEQFLEEFFKTEGHFCLKAESAAEALESTRRFQPDLILLNSSMGAHSGLSLIPELLAEQPSAALILMAAKPNVLEAVEAMKLGAVDYLQRPLDPGRLKLAIENQKALFKLN